MLFKFPDPPLNFYFLAASASVVMFTVILSPTFGRLNLPNIINVLKIFGAVLVFLFTYPQFQIAENRLNIAT